ncbi:hypothetical protein TRFO_40850 [Tritrichomonas foetus]|uniref:Uncharacterized protein n=1 Tax=Tritrichomonas foetus TaxID=1144522 RepID=A0A1J4J5A4_9EUKA|nr:hypothetical protein TRFO_40850 [Tritrichomonas foetus]|eukprot:OHS92827.1 hypothetical protein TRFO_40850 [Tritrichomonas foetus]
MSKPVKSLVLHRTTDKDCDKSNRKRAKDYGHLLEKVEKALVNSHGKKMNFSEIKQLQRILCMKEGLKTNRAAWRTKVGAKLWLCEKWDRVQPYQPFYKLLDLHSEQKDIFPHFNTIDLTMASIIDQQIIILDNAIEVVETIEATIPVDTIDDDYKEEDTWGEFLKMEKISLND